jgi:hypothetical protein
LSAAGVISLSFRSRPFAGIVQAAHHDVNLPASTSRIRKRQAVFLADLAGVIAGMVRQFKWTTGC